jgi:hypothetical protein
MFRTLLGHRQGVHQLLKKQLLNILVSLICNGNSHCSEYTQWTELSHSKLEQCVDGLEVFKHCESVTIGYIYW